MPVGADEREVCSVRGCHRGVWFTDEQMCRHHGNKRGVPAAQPPAVMVENEGEHDE